MNQYSSRREKIFKSMKPVYFFNMSGGEPFLYKHTADIIEYIDSKYRNKIGTFRMVTNGTVVPKDEVLEKISKCRIEIKIDDYRKQVPKYNDNFDKLNSKLDEYGITHYAYRVDEWIDLAPEKTDYSMLSEEELVKHRDSCSQTWEELRGGKLYSCNYAAYATVAGIAGEQDMEEARSVRWTSILSLMAK